MTSSSADVNRVVTQDGYEIKATEWHDSIQVAARSKLKDLKPGDELLIQSGKGSIRGCGGAGLGQLLACWPAMVISRIAARARRRRSSIVGTPTALLPTPSLLRQSLIAASPSARELQRERDCDSQRNLVMIRSVILARVLAQYDSLRKRSSRFRKSFGAAMRMRQRLFARLSSRRHVNTSAMTHSCSVRSRPVNRHSSGLADAAGHSASSSRAERRKRRPFVNQTERAGRKSMPARRTMTDRRWRIARYSWRKLDSDREKNANMRSGCKESA